MRLRSGRAVLRGGAGSSREVGTRLPASISLYHLAFITRAETTTTAAQLYLEGLELAVEVATSERRVLPEGLAA